MGVEGLAQGFRHLRLVHSLKVGALQHEDLLAVLEEADAGRRRRIGAHVSAGSLHCVTIDAREHRHRSVRDERVLERQHGARTGLAGGTAADRVHDDEGGAGRRGERLIDLFRRGQGLDADRSQLLPQGFDGFGIVDGRQWHGISLCPGSLSALHADGYRGFFFPNTAYAKLGTGIPASELVAHGGWYFVNSLKWDAPTLLMIAAALRFAFGAGLAQRLCGSLQADIGKTRERLGWAPPVGVDAALAVTADDFLAGPR